jgi:hypothetical protein
MKVELDFQKHVVDVVTCIIFYEFESRAGEVYSVQHYVIKFVSDLRRVGVFLRVLRFPPPTKLTATIKLKYC